jgi:transposase
VGAIITRVWVNVEAGHDRFADLSRIGVDEIFDKRGQRYLTVVVDHDSGRWCGPHPAGRRPPFSGSSTPSVSSAAPQISHVSADGADWISAVVTGRCPNAVRCADPFHIVKWATSHTEALDDVRRQAWNAARSRPGGRADRVRWSRGRLRQDAAGQRNLVSPRLIMSRHRGWILKAHVPPGHCHDRPVRAPGLGGSVACGYPPRPIDYHDVPLLCERFDLNRSEAFR